MKILKIFGVVVGVHVFALILIFANPGCSSANKPASVPTETVIQGDTASHAGSASASAPSGYTPVRIASVEPSTPPPSFDPNAPAATVRFSPTRPGTPTASALERQPVSDVTPATTYTVVKGDSLWTIARKNHLSSAELAVANNLKPGATIRIGQKLIIPGKPLPSVDRTAAEPVTVTRAPASEVHPPAHARGEAVKHVVKSGETLGAIARKYQVSVGEIATANNIADPKKIRPGMELVIPGWQAPASKKSTAAKSPSAESPATNAPASTSASVPTVVIPPPGQDIDSGLKNKNDEPPVIKVDDQ